MNIIRHGYAHFDKPGASQPGAKQQGMVLLLCLIFMTALTLLGLAASTDTITQRQLAINLQDDERAIQSAQLALRWVENWLFQLPGPAPEICSTDCTGLFIHPANSVNANIPSAPLTWWVSQGFEAGLDPETGARLATLGMPGVEPPMWVIQSLHHSPASLDGSTPELDWYRILVRTTGQSANTVSVFESVIKRNWTETVTAVEFAGRVSWRELR